MRILRVVASILLCSTACGGGRFVVTFPGTLNNGPLDGRLLLMISADSTQEPRFQINDGLRTQLVFGITVDGWKPGVQAVVDDAAPGFPLQSLSAVPAGTYRVQALLHRYETFHRADGHTVKLPMDRGEGQQWNAAPGNLYSIPRTLRIDPSTEGTIRIELDRVIPPIEPLADTKYLRHIRMKSERLSAFWGRPMELGATVLLPHGWDEHPDARYPVIVYQSHFSPTFDGFREAPPDPNLPPVYSERFHIEGYNRIEQEYAYKFYQEWTGPGFPRFILIQIQHANPYYDDSYAVNSENLGPYGDAIMKELIPTIEKKFRAIGQGWARFTYGGSTGGWEALAAQVFYPDEFNGCFAACPDPIDFRSYTIVNIYEHENAYFAGSRWKKTPRPGTRNGQGELMTTLQEENKLEYVLGPDSRSGGQWDIWQAVYSPVGTNGYPRPIWDKLTGVIDRDVAAYWRDHYDLSYILQRDWKTLGPKLAGKIHIYCGTMDNYFLNNAVARIEEFLKSTRDPYYGGEVDYGDRAEHCWNGDHANPIWISRLRYHQFFAPRIVARMLKTAPAGADTTSWRY